MKKRIFPETATVAEVAAFYRTDRRHILNLIKRKLLPAAKIAGKYVLIKSDVYDFFNRQIPNRRTKV